MKITVGDLRKRVTVQRPTPVATGRFNETKPGFTTDTTRWAHILPINADMTGTGFTTTSEYAGQQIGEATHTVVLRHYPNLSTNWRILYKTHTYNIVGLVNLEENGWWTLCFVKEVDAAQT